MHVHVTGTFTHQNRPKHAVFNNRLKKCTPHPPQRLRRLYPRTFGARPSCPPNEMSGSVTGIADVNTYSIMVHKHTNDAIPLRSNVAHLS